MSRSFVVGSVAAVLHATNSVRVRLRALRIVFFAIATLIPSASAVIGQSYSDRLADISMKISVALDGAHVKSVSVLDFTDLQGMPTELGRLLAQDLSDQLVWSTHSYAVIDRQNVNLLLKEHSLSQDGLIDPRTRRQLGNLIGIDAAITGTAVPLGSQVRLNVRAVSLETGRVIAAAGAMFAMTPELESLNDRGVRQDGGNTESPRASAEIRLTRALSVEVSSLTRRNEKLVTTLTFRNRGTGPASIALIGPGTRAFCNDFQLSDGRGGFCEACGMGLTSLPIYKPQMRYSGGGWQESSPTERGWAQVAPSSTAQHVVSFSERLCSTPISGHDGLTLSGSVMVDEGGGASKIPVSFSNLQLYSPRQ